MDTFSMAIGIIGYRGFGAFCTEAFHASGHGRVVAYAGRDSRAMAETAKKYGVTQTYTDWHRLIEDPAVELVHIVTPPSLHAEMAVAALRAGKHVFGEKPLATSNADAQAILDAAQTAGKVVGINYVMRYDPLYQVVQQIAHEGILGALTHVEFQNYASDEGLGDDHWFWDKELSGGIFIEHGVHFFDIIGAIVGAPASRVVGQTWIRPDGTNKEDRVQALVTYENGVEASFYHAFNRPGALEKQSAHFAFAQGHFTLDGWIPTTLHLNAIVSDADLCALRRVLPVTIVDDEDFAGTGIDVRGSGRMFHVQHRVHAREQLAAPTPVYKTAVGDALTDLVQAIRDPQHVRRVTAEDGATSLRVAVAARDSADSGMPQEIKSL
jgi:predicted dehydrogenase